MFENVEMFLLVDNNGFENKKFKQRAIIFSEGRVMAHFVPNFVAMARVNINETVKWTDPENHT